MCSIRFQWQWLSKLTMIVMLAVPSVSSATVVRMQTSLGIIDIQLYGTAAPLTVANFLDYVRSGAYTNSFLHRSKPGFIIQGGGFVWDKVTQQPNAIATNPPVANEFDASRSNIRGTIAMAKLGDDPTTHDDDVAAANSATNQWFFNLADNSSNLDAQNGGFTVFGKVVNVGMGVVDAIAALPRSDASNVFGAAFTDWPFLESTTTISAIQKNLVIIKKVTVLPAGSNASNRVFAYLESLHPDKLLPYKPLNAAKKESKWGSGYYYRYYAKTKKYLATSKGNVYWGDKLGKSLTPIGTLDYWLAAASTNGY